jgi:hypothetical protein
MRDTVTLNPKGKQNIVIRIEFIGLLKTKYSAKVFDLFDELKSQSGRFPDFEPDDFLLPNAEKENIDRTFILNTLITGIDPENFPDWKVICRTVRLSNPEKILKETIDEGKFEGNNMDDSRIFIDFINAK